jgi:hypothetical protein
MSPPSGITQNARQPSAAAHLLFMSMIYNGLLMSMRPEQVSTQVPRNIAPPGGYPVAFNAAAELWLL